jgi:hypothetical protein
LQAAAEEQAAARAAPGRDGGIDAGACDCGAFARYRICCAESA